jgi:hypothetical protein
VTLFDVYRVLSLAKAIRNGDEKQRNAGAEPPLRSVGKDVHRAVAQLKTHVEHKIVG